MYFVMNLHEDCSGGGAFAGVMAKKTTYKWPKIELSAAMKTFEF